MFLEPLITLQGVCYFSGLVFIKHLTLNMSYGTHSSGRKAWLITRAAMQIIKWRRRIALRGKLGFFFFFWWSIFRVWSKLCFFFFCVWGQVKITFKKITFHSLISEEKTLKRKKIMCGLPYCSFLKKKKKKTSLNISKSNKHVKLRKI